METRLAVLLMAYGSPDTLDDVEAYFTHIRRGHKPDVEEILELKQRYQKIGGRSPLLEITRQQASLLEKTLQDLGIAGRVYVGMKHWHPFIEEVVLRVSRNGFNHIIALPLAPHYSRMSIGGYEEAFLKGLENTSAPFKTSFVKSWHLNPLFIKAWTERLLEGLQAYPKPDREDVFVLFSAHSLPQSILDWNDPYPKQLSETCLLLAQALNLEQWAFSYQSASHTKEKWLGPDILEKLSYLHEKGYRNILVAPIGFVADHLEILYDIDIECQAFARENGLNLRRTQSLNTSPTFIAALASIVREQAERLQ